MAMAEALLAEIHGLRRDADRLSGPDTFVQSAKMQRSANAKEKELAGLWEDHKGSENAGVLWWMSILRAVASITFVLWLWSVRLVCLDESLVWPVGSFLKFPQYSNPQGSITIIPWIIACDRASRALLQVVLPMKVVGSKAALWK
eukprot:evm.model.scf_844EXC.1 EVM.evm.TU.scf_844EXC.1   scf_844EXC:3709-4988(+)